MSLTDKEMTYAQLVQGQARGGAGCSHSHCSLPQHPQPQQRWAPGVKGAPDTAPSSSSEWVCSEPSELHCSCTWSAARKTTHVIAGRYFLFQLKCFIYLAPRSAGRHLFYLSREGCWPSARAKWRPLCWTTMLTYKGKTILCKGFIKPFSRAAKPALL